MVSPAQFWADDDGMEATDHEAQTNFQKKTQ
jgi:hypothetical protein